MDEWKETYPAEIHRFFGEGFYTGKYSTGNWNGNWDDMEIEEPVMQDGRTSTGIVHGTLSNDSSVVTWFHFIEKTS